MKGHTLGSILGIVLFAGVSPLRAIQVADPINYPAPPGGFPLGNLGSNNTSSAIYLGNFLGNNTYWALTAAHITQRNLVFNGVTYIVTDDDRHQIRNLSGSGFSNTDLLLVQLDIAATPTGLVDLKIPNFLPGPSETTYLAGRGGNVRWGTSHINYPNGPGTSPLLRVNSGSTTTMTFATLTLPNDPTNPQTAGWGISGDSGGGHFFYDEGNWYLSGLLIGVNYLPAGNYTYAAALNYYYPQLYQIAIPEPTGLVLLAVGLLPILGHRLRRKA